MRCGVPEATKRGWCTLECESDPGERSPQRVSLRDCEGAAEADESESQWLCIVQSPEYQNISKEIDYPMAWNRSIYQERTCAVIGEIMI